jgi:hypothetical protein
MRYLSQYSSTATFKKENTQNKHNRQNMQKKQNKQNKEKLTVWQPSDGISLHESIALFRASESIFENGRPCHLKIASHDGRCVSYDAPVSDDALAVLNGSQSSATALVVLTGVYILPRGKGGPWRIMVDLSLAVVIVAKNTYPKSQRVHRVVTNLQTGDFAKGLQRTRCILSKSRKGAITSAMNKQVGGLRFLVKQLEVVQAMGDCEAARRYAQDQLHLAARGDGIAHWMSLATTAMQAQARAVIEQHRVAFFQTFCTHHIIAGTFCGSSG